MVSNECRALIKEGLTYYPWYGDGFSNHLSMSLVALDKMGASSEQLKRYYLSSIQRLVPRNASNQKFELRYKKYLLELEKEDYELFVQKELKHLIKGVCGAAFHPMIRLYYAKLSGVKEEMAMALAYWSMEYLELPGFTCKSDKSPEEIVEHLTRISPTSRTHSSNITNRIKAKSLEISRLKECIIPEEITFEEIRLVCLRGLAQNNDFTILHTLTSSQAFEYLHSVYSLDSVSLKHYWTAILVAYLSCEKSFSITHENHMIDEDCSWEDILKMACDSDDDHVIKLVYTCWVECQKYSNVEYYTIAKRALTI